MIPSFKLNQATGLIGIGLVLGVLLGYAIWSQGSQGNSIVKTESFQPEIINKDGSVTLERISQPENQVKQKMKLPELPKGALVRVDAVELQPTGTGPVKVMLATTQEADGERVTVQAEGAAITGGQDIFIPRPTVKAFRWNAMIHKEWIQEKTFLGTSLGYERGRLILQASVFPENRQFSIGAGVRW